jgi:PKD repeat protein
VTASYIFVAAGIYQISLTVTDSAGNVVTTTTVGGADAHVVVFDAGAGHVTGGGWFNSPAGSSANPAYVGRASFAFNAQYHGDSATPDGQLQFRVGRLNFHSSSFEWLVVNAAKAQFRGTGTVNGRGTFAFLLTIIDGRRAGGADMVRMTIWDPGTDFVLYDSGGTAGDDDDSLHVLGGGDVTIHE